MTLECLQKNTYRFNIGDFDCKVILDASSRFDIKDFFPDVPDSEIDKAIDEHQINPNGRLDSLCLLIEKGNNKILVESGVGFSMPHFGEGQLTRILKDNGIDPSEIDTVIFSHAHPDHIGGNIDAKGNAVFANARHVLSEDEYQFWLSPNPDLSNVDISIREEMLDCVNKNLIAIQEKFNPVTYGTEIIPGLKIIGLSGHTVGQIGIVLSSQNERLCVVSDMFHHVLEIYNPHWYSSFDSLPEEAVVSRIKMMSQIVEKDMLMLACHFPFPGLGKLSKTDATYNWHPV